MQIANSALREEQEKEIDDTTAIIQHHQQQRYIYSHYQSQYKQLTLLLPFKAFNLMLIGKQTRLD
jgi:hypothetical protein